MGYAFLTSDLPPEQRGFDGPIEVLVGMNLSGELTGVMVTQYEESLRESRGDFLSTRGFQEQFSGKSILDPFQVRRDLDGITGATITVDAMARGIRNAARRVALAHRMDPVTTPAELPLLDPVSITYEELRQLTWTEMGFRGLIQEIPVLDEGRTVAELSLLYLRDEVVAEILVGPLMLRQVRDALGPSRTGHLVLAGVDGPLGGALNLARLSLAQRGDTVGVGPEEILLFGPADQGTIANQVRFVRVLAFDGTLDMTQPSTFVLDLRPGLDRFVADYPGLREAEPVLDGVDSYGGGPDTPSQESVIGRTPATSWVRAGLVLSLLLLALMAYMGTRARRR